MIVMSVNVEVEADEASNLGIHEMQNRIGNDDGPIRLPNIPSVDAVKLVEDRLRNEIKGRCCKRRITIDAEIIRLRFRTKRL